MMKLLEDQVKQFQCENETVTKNYDEEQVESEALTNKLKDTLGKLEKLHNNFSKLEIKLEIRTCSEHKSLIDKHDDIKKELAQSNSSK